ncbi:hypothetical protein D878_gp30 [Sulfolobales Mexican rudivirus 1]|jgi:hypothetical protein|uniref:Uncharacterized protein n=1 Tax=Sulfolobales Mexican rod-shaped virus 1 TaxID=2848122 RepID=K4PAK4_9VIRU|nr:hypothetical protein D878_gp30 [Sulfolobales Mexican rudivirus 1]AFV51257.1 hypothetical protein [Sulfolobales Mexican rod-shaped virus 1]
MSNANDEFSVIAFLVHAVIFVVMLIGALANPSLFDNQNYLNILYLVLGTLVAHGGYQAGKVSSK